MPIFGYRCESCGHAFDELQRLDAKPLRECPACDEPALRKLPSAPRFRLKGGGWKNSEDPAPRRKPKFVHTFDSPVPHADHHADHHADGAKTSGESSHGHAHGHKHSHDD